MSTPRVVALARSAEHQFSKQRRETVELVEGQGVAGDAHSGALVQHRSRVRRDPTQPNLRQVHLIAQELLDELAVAGFAIGPGVLGENVTTSGVDLLALPTGTLLRIGEAAVVEITGLRNPCVQVDDLGPGLLKRVLRVDADGTVERRAGVMGVVLTGGRVRVGDAVEVTLPDEPHIGLSPV